MAPHVAGKTFWKYKCSQQRNVVVQSQTRGMHSQRPSNCCVLVSCPSFSSLILSTSCHVLSACKRQDAISVNKQGDFYWTVKVTLSEIILTVLALSWYTEEKLYRMLFGSLWILSSSMEKNIESNQNIKGCQNKWCSNYSRWEKFSNVKRTLWYIHYPYFSALLNSRNIKIYLALSQ